LEFFLIVFGISLAFYFIAEILGSLFFFWLRWRLRSSVHQAELKATGVFGISFTGVIRGFFIFVAGLIVKNHALKYDKSTESNHQINTPIKPKDICQFYGSEVPDS
jgi:hypothetical protein